jgi:F-type H+-transporting ATPase subunit delta
MKVSKVAIATARRVFRMCWTNGRFDEAKLRSAMKWLTANKPRNYRGVLFALKRMVRLELDRRHAVIESAGDLDEQTKLRVAANLGSKYGGDLTFTYRSVPGLIGGLRVRVGSDVWDGTVKGRLDRLANAF